jgi:hypothetical protein
MEYILNISGIISIIDLHDNKSIGSKRRAGLPTTLFESMGVEPVFDSDCDTSNRYPI